MHDPAELVEKQGRRRFGVVSLGRTERQRKHMLAHIPQVLPTTTEYHVDTGCTHTARASRKNDTLGPPKRIGESSLLLGPPTEGFRQRQGAHASPFEKAWDRVGSCPAETVEGLPRIAHARDVDSGLHRQL